MTAARQHAASGNYLYFDVGEYRFCAPVADVEAIVELNGIHRLPVAPRGVSGTFMFRDHIAVVCDLGEVLNVTADGSRKKLSVVVRLPIGLIAFRVDHVSDIVAASEVQPQKADERAMKEWMDGYVMQGPHIAFLTTFDKLLRLFGVTSLANLEAAPTAAEPSQPKLAQARAVQAALSDAAALAPVANRQAIAADTAREESVARVAAVAREEVAAPPLRPDTAAPDADSGAPVETRATAETAAEAPAVREVLPEDAALPELAASDELEPEAARDGASREATLEPTSSSEWESEALAREFEFAAPPSMQPEIAAAPGIVEPQELVPQPEPRPEEAPIESPMLAEVAALEGDAEPVAYGESAPEATDLEADLSSQSAAFADSEAAAVSVPEIDEPRNVHWEEERPRDALDRAAPAEAQAAPSQESQSEERGFESEAVSIAVLPGETHDQVQRFEDDDRSLTGSDAAESWTEPEHRAVLRARAEMVEEARRADAVWTSDSAIYSGEADAQIAAGYRDRPAASARPPDTGGRSHAALAVLVGVLLAAIVGGWWWLVSPQPQPSAEVRRPAESAPPQPVAQGPIAQPTEKLEIVGKDFELRVEPAAPAESGAPRVPPAPASRNEFVHVVVRGDTLWDIAAKYLGNPYRYPELARNSAIRNPDLIHPGDVVRIRKRR